MSQNLAQPIPQGKYISAIRHGDVIFTSGMTPRKSGKLLYSGKIGVKDALESHKDAVQLAALNALTAMQSCLKEGEKVAIILQLNVFLNTDENFTLHSKIADFASDFLIKNLGASSIGSRAAIGVASLPSNAPVEITLTGKVV